MRKTTRFVIVLISTFCGFSSSDVLAQNRDSPQKSVDDAISAAERVCLVGTRYKFAADLKGGVMITKIVPGGQLSGTYDEIRTRGAPDFTNEEIRRFVDSDIRECMGKQWPRVLEVLKSVGVTVPPPGEKSEVVKVRVNGNLEVGLETAGAGKYDVTFGLIAVNRANAPIRLLIHNTQHLGPMFIDDKGRASSTQDVMGVPTCRWDAGACFREVPIEQWAIANTGQHLPISLRFPWATVTTGALVNLSFTLLQAVGRPQGGYSFSSVPVSFLRVPVDK